MTFFYKNTLYAAVKACLDASAEPLVEFSYISDSGDKKKVSQKTGGELLDDWYSDCNFCPPNDTVINCICFTYRVQGETSNYPIPIKCKFEEFMSALEAMYAERDGKPMAQDIETKFYREGHLDHLVINVSTLERRAALEAALRSVPFDPRDPLHRPYADALEKLLCNSQGGTVKLIGGSISCVKFALKQQYDENDTVKTLYNEVSSAIENAKTTEAQHLYSQETMEITDVFKCGTNGKYFCTVKVSEHDGVAEYVDVSVREARLPYIIPCDNGLEVYADNSENGIRNLSSTEKDKVIKTVKDNTNKTKKKTHIDVERD